ncbi:OpgC family protein [Kiloniella sp. b19]|uniref:OpgC family protein n=1 Tax=Kiloniella sp. GXU_MW_B19 TaxID=3141326 RepID=UPI0031D22D1C
MTGSQTTSAPAAQSAAGRRPRDPRLDIFRGLSMFIIFIAHLPGNSWTLWIPARFGFSDATETFVFCSGMASSFAFASVFKNHGWWMGTARISHRVWQVYWAQIAVFLVIAGGLAFLNLHTDGTFDYVKQLNLHHFFNDPMPQLVGLFTLTYVPNLFDILPMYIVILALIPAVMFFARIHLLAVLAFVVGLWLLAQYRLVEFPAEPWSDRIWYFNPLGWQLVFFTGFAFGLGWLKVPALDKRLVWLCAAIVVAIIPLDFHLFHKAFPEIKAFWQSELVPVWINKTHFGLFRFIHFLATAYLAWAAFEVYGHRLMQGRTGQFFNIIRKVGQQSLAVFLMGLVASWFLGLALKEMGRTGLNTALFNLLGFAILIATAYIVSWFKGQPWRKKPEPRVSEDRTQTETSPSALPAAKHMRDA